MSNPYLSNSLAYSNVLESVSATARFWRIISLISMLIAGAAVAGVIYIGSQSKIIPVVVTVNGEGTPTNIYNVDRNSDTRQDRITRATIAKVIEIVRGVSSDANLMKKRFSDLIHFFERTGPGFVATQKYLTAKEGNPFERAKKELVDIYISDVIKLSADTWQAEWREVVKERNGNVKTDTRWKATINTDVAENITEQTLYVNPTGLLIHDLVVVRRLVNE